MCRTILQPNTITNQRLLSYELRRQGAGAGHTENLVNLFTSVLEASERKHGQGGTTATGSGP